MGDVQVESITLNPATECSFIDPFELKIVFSTDRELQSYCWKLSYTVDTSKRRKIVELGNTDLVTYPPGRWEMSFVAPAFDPAELPADIVTQLNGMLSAKLTGPSGEEPMTVNMVVQVQPAADGSFIRQIFNPL